MDITELIEQTKRVLDGLTKFYDEDAENAKKWTSETNKRFIALGKQYAQSHGYLFGEQKTGAGKTVQVCTSGEKPDQCDYLEMGYNGILYDHAWFVYDVETGHTYKMPVVMETEWKTGGTNATDKTAEEELFKDFLKVVVSAAELKIMVVWVNNKKRGEDIIAKFKKQIEIFEPRIGIYLLSFVYGHPRKFVQEIVTCRPLLSRSRSG